MGIVYPERSDNVTSKPAQERASARRCIVTREVREKTDLVRFVLDPSGGVVPDVACRLPGRGLWVSADYEILRQAVDKNHFSRAAKVKAIVEPDLIEQTALLLKKRVFDFLGLAKRAGAVVFGVPQIERYLQKESLLYVLLAEGCGKDTRAKLKTANCVETGFHQEELGPMVGRDAVAALGLERHELAGRLLEELKRWQGVRPAQILYN